MGEANKGGESPTAEQLRTALRKARAAEKSSGSSATKAQVDYMKLVRKTPGYIEGSE